MSGKPWFRLYSDMPDNPKIGMLDDATHRCWIECLCFAAQQGESGRVGTLSEINWKCRREYSEQLQKLVKCDALRVTGDVFYVSQWRHRQYESDSSRTRTQKYRDKKKTEKTTPGVTSQDRHIGRHCDAPRADTEQIQNNIVTNVTPDTASPEDDGQKPVSYSPEFDAWWACYPNRKEKPSAFTEWKKAIRKTTPEVLQDSLQAYLGTRQVRDGFAPYPAKWLKQERWAEDHTLDTGKPNAKPSSKHTGFADIDYAGSAKDSGFVVA